MQRVNGYYLYQVGHQIHPISGFQTFGEFTTTYAEARFPLIVARGALEPFLTAAVFRLRTSGQDGHALLDIIKRVLDRYATLTDASEKIPVPDLWGLQDALQRFESVLAAEFGTMHLYIVSKKGGLDITDLIWQGETCFPPDLLTKAPDALLDVREAARCIAFELPTAAAYHLHRANEAVLRHYFDAVAGGIRRPRSRNMGDYLKILTEKNLGSSVVRAALRDLKDLHRNPIAHPEHSLETVEEAIDLMGAVRAVIGAMLREIPMPPAQASLGALVAAHVTAGPPPAPPKKASSVKKKAASKRRRPSAERSA